MTTIPADPWWRRSWVGQFVLYVGTLAIYAIVDGTTPSSEALIGALVLLVGGIWTGVRGRGTVRVEAAPKPLLRADQP